MLRPETIKLLEENIYFGSVSSGKGNKGANKQMGLHQTKKVLHSEGNYQNEKVTYWMEKTFANSIFSKA